MSNYQLDEKQLVAVLTNHVKEELIFSINKALHEVADPLIYKCAMDLAKSVGGQIATQYNISHDRINILFKFGGDESPAFKL